MTRHSELSPAESLRVHDLATAAGLHPLRIEADPQMNLVFHAGERVFDVLADWCTHAKELAAVRRGEVQR